MEGCGGGEGGYIVNGEVRKSPTQATQARGRNSLPCTGGGGGETTPINIRHAVLVVAMAVIAGVRTTYSVSVEAAVPYILKYYYTRTHLEPSPALWRRRPPSSFAPR